MNTFKYYLRDSREGITRNLAASTASVLLIFISLTITGAIFLLKFSVDDLIDYLDSQAKVKIFIDSTVETEEVARILRDNSSIKSIEIETSEQMLDNLKGFFEGREYLFEAFYYSDIPDTILLEFGHQQQVVFAAEELKEIEGITDVVYAQEFAQAVLKWSNMAERYGGSLLLIVIFIAFLTVSVTINLSLYQRQRDIRVKLLLGAKDSHVRGQFLFEGFLLGLIGGILASFMPYLLYYFVFLPLQIRINFIFQFDVAFINSAMLAVIFGGVIIGGFASYLSTKKLIKDA